MTSFGTSFADAVYDRLSPIANQDAQNNYALRTFIRALGAMFQEVDWLAQESTDGPGWSRVLNLNLVPDDAIPWLAQFVGVSVDPALSPAQQRLLVAAASGWNRGRISAMVAAAQLTLTGQKTVTVIERDGDPYILTVVTKNSETPDPAATLFALLTQKPAGIRLNYQNLIGQTYGNLLTNAPLYSNAFSTYATYKDLLFNNSAPPTTPTTFGTGTFGTGTFGGGT